MLALGALAWLAWDWTHDQSLNSAEDALFDQVVNRHPVEPTPSGRVVVVEIDECSSEYFRASREGYADLLDGINVRGYEKPRAYGMRE